MSKIGFSTYVHEQFSGFEGKTERIGEDLAEFPDFGQRLLNDPAVGRVTMKFCVGPVQLTDGAAVHEDVDAFTNALGAERTGGFMNAPTPGQVVFNNPNRYYPSHAAYLAAVAEVLRYEYKAITDAGLVLQLDSPDLAMAGHYRFGTGVGELLPHIDAAIEALNHALDGIPPHQLRLHVCWGNYIGPHHKDVPLETIIDRVLRANVQTLSVEAANPRHEHEWEVFKTVRLPDERFSCRGSSTYRTRGSSTRASSHSDWGGSRILSDVSASWPVPTVALGRSSAGRTSRPTWLGQSSSLS